MYTPVCLYILQYAYIYFSIAYIYFSMPTNTSVCLYILQYAYIYFSMCPTNPPLSQVRNKTRQGNSAF